jgi:hypothetical protein
MLGHVVSASAPLDFHINTTIWELANVERWIGRKLLS